MVAAVYVAVVLHHAGVAAGLCQSAYAGLFAHPVGKCAVEHLNEVVAHVAAHPFVEDSAQEIAPLLCGDREFCHRVARLAWCGEVPPVGMAVDALHDRCKLYVVAINLFKETIEVERIVGVVVVHHSHGVPLHTVAVEALDALHDLSPRGSAAGCATIFVVKLLRPVNRHAHQPAFVGKKPAPLVGEQRGVGLQAVVDDFAMGISLLQLHGSAIERQRAHECLAAVPSEQHLLHGLRVDVLVDEALKQLVAHHALALRIVEARFLKVVAVGAAQIAARTCGLEHHIQWAGKWVENLLHGGCGVECYGCSSEACSVLESPMMNSEKFTLP